MSDGPIDRSHAANDAAVSGGFTFTEKMMPGQPVMKLFDFDCPMTRRLCVRDDCLPGRVCWKRAIDDAAEAVEQFGDDVLEAGL